jgi:predicted MFS family arabinose efflux permease
MLKKTISLYKNSFSGLSKETWLLSFIMLVNRSGTMVLPFMTLHLTSKEMHRSISEAGFVMALYGAGSIVGAYFGGKFSDKIGFFKVQLLALLFGGISFIILGQLHDYLLICIMTFLLSMINESFRPANSSAIAFYSNPENRTRSYSLNRLAINLGWAVGGLLGGIIASYAYEFLFWVDGFSNILAALLFLYFFKQQKTEIKKTKEDKIVPASQSAYRDKKYIYFITMVVLFGFCFFQLFTNVPNFFRDSLSLSVKYIGFLMAVNGIIIVVLEMVMIFYLEKKSKNSLFIAIGCILCALSFLTLLIPGPAKLIAFIMIVFITFGEMFAMPFMNNVWTQRSNDSNRGQYAALYTMAWGAAQTTGPFICSLIIDAYGFNIFFVVMGILLFLTAFGSYRFSK